MLTVSEDLNRLTLNRSLDEAEDRIKRLLEHIGCLEVLVKDVSVNVARRQREACARACADFQLDDHVRGVPLVDGLEVKP